MKKKIWLTSLTQSQEAVGKVMTSLKKYGLEIDGHFWEDDLAGMGWAKPRRELLDDQVKMWCIHGTPEDLAKETVRYGLSLLALTLQASKGTAYPVYFLQDGGAAVASSAFPYALHGSTVLSVADGSYGAKIVAALHKPSAVVFPPYRLDIYGIPQVGQWFEVGPREQAWQGAIFAESGAAITAHGVGESGRLPESCVLNYPQKGLKLEVGEQQFEGWAVQNELETGMSYFVKVDGEPEAIMFCPYSQEDETEAYIIDLA